MRIALPRPLALEPGAGAPDAALECCVHLIALHKVQIRSSYAPESDYRSTVAAWALILIMAVIDTVGARDTGMQVVHASRIALTLGLLGAISFAFGNWARSPKVAQAAVYAALWVSFNLVLVILTYLVAELRMPLWDATFARMDSALGFHWLAWYRAVHPHHTLDLVLRIVYSSIVPQIVFSLSLFAYLGHNDRNAELLWTTMISALIATAVSSAAPALGPCADGHLTPWMQSLIALRSGAVSAHALGGLQGIITMPSFHAVLAVLFVYTNRPPMRSFYPIAALNLLMLFSLLPIGHHYLVDMIGGVLVALASIVAYRAALSIYARLAAVRISESSGASEARLERDQAAVLDAASSGGAS
jgi:PAP2 superfamily